MPMKNLLVIALLLVAPVAAAEPIVVAVDGPDIYVDLGAKDGVGAGAELELLHEVVVRDPRSGTMLRDHFSLGTISVVKSGEKISVARADDDLKKRVLAGDRVKLVSAVKKFVDPWAEQVAASKPQGPGPAPAPAPTGKPTEPINHAELAKKAFQDTLGKPLDARVARWLDLLRDDPRSPYAAAVQREISTLKNQIAVREQALAKARSENTADRAPRIARLAAMLPPTTDAVLAIAPIASAEPGKPLAIAFLVRDPERVTRAWLYVRPPGAPGFKRLDLAADGDAYLRATLDGDMVRAPGVQWYVEGSTGTEGSATEPLLGSQTAPNTISVERAVAEAPIEEGRSHIDAHIDYVDFDGGFSKGYDQYYQAEIDFTYRFLKPVYAVRLGFGTLGGMGGPKDVIDEDMTDRCLDEAGNYRCKSVSFSYVYTEVEYRIRPNVALMLRPQAGLLTTDVMASSRNPRRCAGATNVEGCQFLTGFGGRVRVRLGDESSTNLVIGAGFTDGVGTLLEAAYNWRPHPVVPIQLSVNVTDQPVPENFGVRLIGDVGWRKLSWFYPSLRLSYQARDIDHAGFSGGLAMNFDW
jgi:hypothetical protein